VALGGMRETLLWGLLALVILRALAWIAYRARLQAGAPEMTNRVLATGHPGILIGGHLMPAGLVIGALLFTEQAAFMAALAGLVAAGVGWAMKFIIVVRASYNQGFAIERVPSRGGIGIAGGVQPGWQ